jgi:hypothetical protein
MKDAGYDDLHPVVIWDEKDILVDGHTRVLAAEEAGVSPIPCVRRSFESQEAALDYVLGTQGKRRNLADSDILHLVDKLDQLRERGGDRRSEKAGSKTSGQVPGPSSKDTAARIGTTATKIDNARAVQKAGTEIRGHVQSSEWSLHKAAQKARALKPKKPSGRARTPGEKPTPHPPKTPTHDTPEQPGLRTAERCLQQAAALIDKAVLLLEPDQPERAMAIQMAFKWVSGSLDGLKEEATDAAA